MFGVFSLTAQTLKQLYYYRKLTLPRGENQKRSGADHTPSVEQDLVSTHFIVVYQV